MAGHPINALEGRGLLDGSETFVSPNGDYSESGRGTASRPGTRTSHGTFGPAGSYDVVDNLPLPHTPRDIAKPCSYRAPHTARGLIACGKRGRETSQTGPTIAPGNIAADERRDQAFDLIAVDLK